MPPILHVPSSSFKLLASASDPVDGLLRFWSSRKRDLPSAAARFTAAAARQFSATEHPLRKLPTEPGPAAELLRAVFNYSAVEERTYRDLIVSRGAGEGLKWEDLECAGLVSLIDARFAVARRKNESCDRHRPSPDATSHPQLVRVCPLAIQALMVSLKMVIGSGCLLVQSKSTVDVGILPDEG